MIFDESGVQVIGGFQLENLVGQALRFNYFNFCQKDYVLNQKAQTLIQSAQWVSEEEALSFLQTQGGAMETPIVCVCETGSLSLKVAQRLVKNGHSNVLVLGGGVESFDF